VATVTKKNVRTAQQHGGVPYGNHSVLPFKLKTTSAGVLSDGDASAAIGINDVVRIGVIPAGFNIQDSLAIVSDAFTATSTADIGFEYVDGVDDANVPQDPDYFNAALAINAVGRTRAANTAVKPVVLPKDAYLIVTNKVAAQASIGELDVLVYGIATGTP
jgi:hypothetical protein